MFTEIQHALSYIIQEDITSRWYSRRQERSSRAGDGSPRQPCHCNDKQRESSSIYYLQEGATIRIRQVAEKKSRKLRNELSSKSRGCEKRLNDCQSRTMASSTNSSFPATLLLKAPAAAGPIFPTLSPRQENEAMIAAALKTKYGLESTRKHWFDKYSEKSTSSTMREFYCPTFCLNSATK